MIDAYLWFLSTGSTGRLLVFVVIAIALVVTVLVADAWTKRGAE